MFLKVKLRCSDLWVTSHDKLSDFSSCAWQRGERAGGLLAMRAVLAAAAVAILAWSLAAVTGPKWLIYLTNWGLVLVAAMTLSALLVSCMAVYRKPADGAATPWPVALYWVLFNVTLTVALAITILYWALLYDPAVIVYESAAAQWLDVATHALNAAPALLELLAARTPLRLAHAWQPLLLAALYVAFSGVYYAAGGTDTFGQGFIYAVLDWSRPGAAGALAAGALLGLLLLHAAACALRAARDALARALLAPRPPRAEPV